MRLRKPGERIRIAYFSRDFRDHPVGHLLRSVFALHDRERFEVYALSYGPDDGSVYRRAIANSVDRFIDVASVNDDDAARAISAAGIDVLVDLMGHTTGSRLGVLARRPAPVQAHYLGYAGTTGAAYIEYFLSDAIATPAYLASAFSEEVVNVPDCFMVSDGTEALGATPSSRSEQHLPDDAFVFCNFGNASRITQAMFESWMGVLRNVPGSVLWLKRSSALVTENLMRAAHEYQVDPKRLVFAERVPDKAAHLGRVALADLALDTIGWHNGHTTAADMLWAGVPVLTAPGQSFASRVASSLVFAASMPELVRDDAADYVETAIRLAKANSDSGALRRELQAARASAPFFDTARLVRGLEGAYERMFAAKIRGSAGL
jgi:predicted O-linked N-acetylglucosamine transferase (SPINDLY family)